MQRQEINAFAQGTLLCGSIAAAGVAPRLLPFLLVFLASVALLIDIVSHRLHFKSVINDKVVILAVLFCTYSAMSAFWATNPNLAYNAAAKFLLITFATAYLSYSYIHLLSHASPQGQVKFWRGIPIGGMIALSFLAIEAVSDSILTRQAITKFPSLAGDVGGGFILRGSEVKDVTSFYLNRNVHALLLFAPSIFLTLLMWLHTKLRFWIVTFFAVLLAFVVFESDSETAKLALVIASFALFLGIQFKITRYNALVALFSILVVFAVPFAKIPYELSLQSIDFLPFSARDRVVIWKHTADKWKNRPLLGIGARNTRAIQDNTNHETKHADPNQPVPRTEWHAHNIYLQLWYELGALGAILFLPFGIKLLGRIRLLQHPAAIAGVCLALISLVSSLVGWGFWQSWYLAACGLSIVGLVVANVSGSTVEPSMTSNTTEQPF